MFDRITTAIDERAITDRPYRVRKTEVLIWWTVGDDGPYDGGILHSPTNSTLS